MRNLPVQHESRNEKGEAVTASPRISQSEDVDRVPPLSTGQIDSRSEILDVPDGGWFAWLQVAGSFALFMNNWGIVNTFGVYQTYYESNLLTNATPDAISWLGAIQAALLPAVGLVSGPLFDSGAFRSLLITGTVLISSGFMFLSLSTEYWHVVLSQAICMGLGCGCLSIPSLAVLPQYFARRRALVTGIATAGASLGGVVYPLIFQGLLSRVGFAWTNRVMGFVVLGTCSFSVGVMRLRAKPRKVRSLLDPSAFREVPYICYCLALWFSYVGFFIPGFYLQTYALSRGVEENLALHLVAIMNAASVTGRVIPGYVASKIGAVNMMLAMAVMAAVAAFSWIAIVNAGPGHVVFAILYGFASGGIVALPAVVLASITADLSFLGARLGMSNFLNAFGSLCGTPVAGAILKTTHNFLWVQLFGAVAISITTVFLLGTRLSRAGSKLWVKV